MLKQKYECQLSSNTWNREFTFFKYVNNVFVFLSVLTNLQVHVIKSKSFDVNELFINTFINYMLKKKSQHDTSFVNTGTYCRFLILRDYT